MRNNFDLPALVEHDHGNRIHKVLVRAKEKEELAQGSDFVLRMRTFGGFRRFWASRGDRRSWESSLALDLDGGLPVDFIIHHQRSRRLLLSGWGHCLSGQQNACSEQDKPDGFQCAFLSDFSLYLHTHTISVKLIPSKEARLFAWHASSI